MPKFIVITVGLEIGVFDNWSLAGPYVRGPGLAAQGPIWQGFPTRAEAERVFAEAERRGITRRIVLGGINAPSSSASAPSSVSSPRSPRASTRRTTQTTEAARSSHARVNTNPRPIPVSSDQVAVASSSRRRLLEDAPMTSSRAQATPLRAHHSAPIVIPPSVFEEAASPRASRTGVRAHYSSPAVMNTEPRPKSRRTPSRAESRPVSISILPSEQIQEAPPARRSRPRRREHEQAGNGRSRRDLMPYASMSTLEDPPTDVTQTLPGGYDDSLSSSFSESSSRRNHPNRTYQSNRTSNMRWRNLDPNTPSPPTNVTQSIPEDAVFDESLYESDYDEDELTDPDTPDMPGSLPSDADSPRRIHSQLSSRAGQLSLADRKRQQDLQRSIEASAAWAQSVARSTSARASPAPALDPSSEHENRALSGLLSPLSEPLRLIARSTSGTGESPRVAAPPSTGASRRSSRRHREPTIVEDDVQPPSSRSSRRPIKNIDSSPEAAEAASHTSRHERTWHHSASRPHSVISISPPSSVHLCSNCKSPVSSSSRRDPARERSETHHGHKRRTLVREGSGETITSASRSKRSSRIIDVTTPQLSSRGSELYEHEHEHGYDDGRNTPPGFGPGATEQLSPGMYGLSQPAHSGVTVLDNAADPRSPMRGSVRVPAGGSEAICFARPSPNMGVDGIARQLSSFHVR